MIPTLNKIFSYISSQRKIQFLFLLLFTVLGAFAEILSLSAIIPFIGALTQPEEVLKNPYLNNLFIFFQIDSADELIFPMTVIFCVAAIFSGTTRLVLQWMSIFVSNSTGGDLSVEIYKRTLYQPYEIHVSRNSSEVISGITQKINSAISALSSIITVVTSLILLIAILITLLFIDPLIASSALISFGSIYFLIAFFTRIRLKKNSFDISLTQTSVVKSLQEGLGAIREILLDNSQIIYSKAYEKNIRKQLNAIGENQYITLAPRFVMESLGMILIALFSYLTVYYGSGQSINSALPVLAALALAAQRLLPLLQQVYGNWSAVFGSQAALEDVLELLVQPMPNQNEIQFLDKFYLKNKISLRNISFKYPDESNYVFKNINVQFEKGTKIGVVGKTGSGKSTFTDLLMGLLNPISGKIEIDEKILDQSSFRAWQKNIAHVPQKIFLIDGTIKDNIVFGSSSLKFDKKLLERVILDSQLKKFIYSLDKGIDTVVGENGIKLSGGQCQRIGLARALYKKPSVLILDEATSSLDDDTEKSVIDAIINKLDKNLTLFMIAHRTTTLKTCDFIYQLEDGCLKNIGGYENLVKIMKNLKK